MLSLRVFGEDITKPHLANLRGKQPETTNEQDEDAVDNAVEHAAGEMSEAGDLEAKVEVDEEAALNA
jgi:hypothetical protein